MKYTILFILFILCTSCHNKNDLEKIKDLEKEADYWKSEVDRWNSIYRYVFDSIENPNKNNMIVTGYKVYPHILISQTSQKRIQLNQEKFESQLRFCIDYSHFVTEYYYSIPQKNKNNSSKIIAIKDGNQFSFTPKDTGWYYWHGNVRLKNYRTGETINHSIIDSFYVYK
ncbi:MAG: hypothetical protein U0U67_04305 [Chitinophagales bacterium]